MAANRTCHPPTTYHLLAVQQKPYKKTTKRKNKTKHTKTFLTKNAGAISGKTRREPQQKNYKTGRARGQGRKTTEERARGQGRKTTEERGNHVTSLRFQTGAGHHTSPVLLSSCQGENKKKRRRRRTKLFRYSGYRSEENNEQTNRKTCLTSGRRLNLAMTAYENVTTL